MTDNHAQRISFARSQLESGLTPATVALRLQVRFSIGRSTAYDVVKDAGNTIHASDDGPSSEELAKPLNTEDLVSQLNYDVQRCLAAGDYANATKLIAAMDKVKRWRGQDGPDGPAWA